MKIRLKEIPQEGRRYQFDRTSAELNETLEDIIGEYLEKYHTIRYM